LWQIINFDTPELLASVDPDSPLNRRIDQSPDSPEQFWRVALNQNDSVNGTWIAPQMGKAMTSGGDVIDLLDGYRANQRSLTQTSLEIFG